MHTCLHLEEAAVATRKSEVLSLRLDKTILSDLEKLADSTKRPKTFLVEEALAEYLNQNAWQVAEIETAIAEADAGDFASEDEVETLTNKYKNA
jgi:RHH-type rel operon transcriptional repressor/antitoxin RelB